MRITGMSLFFATLTGLVVALIVGTLDFSVYLPVSPGTSYLAQPLQITAKEVKLFLAFIVSVIVLIPSIKVAVNKDSPTEQAKWSYGTIGTILGFWIG